MEGAIILVKLFCAHLCADFILQTNRISHGKRAGGLESVCYHLIHGFIHAFVAYVFIAQWSNWLLPLFVLVSHTAIDMIKYYCSKDGIGDFLVDQLCHVLVIFAIWLFMFSGNECCEMVMVNVNSGRVWLVVMSYILMLTPSSILLSKFLSRWVPLTTHGRSLPDAGQWIGYIERVLALTFILIGSIECVGFLLAAKSVFRFGELSKVNEIKTTEYVLIGTLSSFAIAILVGVIVKNVIS